MVTLHPKDQLFIQSRRRTLQTYHRNNLRSYRLWLVRLVSFRTFIWIWSSPSTMASSISCRHDLLPPCQKGQRIILDNSNIVESYPGVSSPLTISFIQEAYASIFRSLAQRLVGKDAPELAAYEATFQNMLQPVNSRVYYQIQSWYQLLQLFAFFSKKIIPIWQDMLGVRDRGTSDAGAPVCFQTPANHASNHREFWTAQANAAIGRAVCPDSARIRSELFSRRRCGRP